MSLSGSVTLETATQSDAPLLSNLLELYIHDMSEVFPFLELGPDGRFGYRRLPLYWSEPDRRFALVIRYDGRIAGFALVTRGSPASPDPEVLDVEEFFVVRKYRRAGVGRAAAFLLWKRFPGQWTVRVSQGNRGALAFWSAVVADFAPGRVRESTLPGEPNAWRVFSFQSPSGS